MPSLSFVFLSRSFGVFVCTVALAFAGIQSSVRAEYTGSVQGPGQGTVSWSSGMDVLGAGGGSGQFTYKGGGNAVDAAVAGALAACINSPQQCSLGGYGGHMLIYRSPLDPDSTGPSITCIDMNSPAGSLASSNMFIGSVNLTNGHWTGPTPAANQIGWKAVGVPGTFAGLYMAQTNYGRKMGGTNLFPFAEIMKPILSRVATGQIVGNQYYTLASVSNLLMDLYTNSPGYRDANGNQNPKGSNDAYAVFYRGDIARDIVAAMQTYGGNVTWSDLTNYSPRVVTPYSRHFNPPNGTAATVYVAPPGSAGVSVLQEVAMLEAIGWTNGPNGTWNPLKYWHARGEMARLMWKDHWRWVGDPWGGALPPDILGNGSTNFADQLIAHVTKGYAVKSPWDQNEILLTNSVAGLIIEAVENHTNNPISVDWDDIRYGTYHISTSDKWGNCVSMTISMGGGFGAQVGVTNRGLVFGQGIALFDARPGWPNSIAPGKRPVDNMSPAIVVPDFPVSLTNGMAGGRAPFATGGGGGSTIENNVAMQVINFLTQPASALASDPTVWLYNFEANNLIYMNPYPAGVQSYLTNAGYGAPGSPSSAGVSYFAEGWIAPTIVSPPVNTNVTSGNTVTFTVSAIGLPLSYQWYKEGVALTDGAGVSGATTPILTVAAVTHSAGYSVVVSNQADSVSASAVVIVDGVPEIQTQPTSQTVWLGSAVTFSVGAVGPAPLVYRWFKNGSALSDGGNVFGATTSVLTINSVANADGGTYSVIVSNNMGSATSSAAALTVLNSSNAGSLLWSVGPSDGKPWMNASTTTLVPNQRTIAYNALSNHLYVISRSSPTTSNYVIYVLNATNGSLLYTLKTNGIQSAVSKSGIGLVGISVADDGAIYACNESNDAEGSGGADTNSYFRVYRWANAHSNTVPSLIYFGDPSGATFPLRWGDCLTARGAGTNTQLLVDPTYFNAYTNSSGSNGYAAILTPANQFMTNFTARWFATTNYVSTVGQSLEFDGTNAMIWQKGAGMPLYKNGYNLAASLGGTKVSSSNILFAPNFPVGLLGLGVDPTRNLAAGVYASAAQAADSLNLYDISDPNAPFLLEQFSFPSNPRVSNGNFISQTFFKNGLLFSIDANNGLMVFRLGNVSPPAITLQPVGRTNFAGTLATFVVGATGPGTLSYQWRKNLADIVSGGNVTGANASTLSVANVSRADAGTYSVVVSNANGSVTSSAALLVVADFTPQLVDTHVNSDGTFEFAYTSDGSQTFTVLFSTNLIDWQPLGSPTQTAPGFFQFVDAGATNVPFRYYQLRSP
ncbi:MAG: Immunoglobulin I-set domain protein [Verrucomicrobiales bacterium]|nr:Immunoglobulin I-set domain protein [Verrucomicrobiales bacterium]